MIDFKNIPSVGTVSEVCSKRKYHGSTRNHNWFLRFRFVPSSEMMDLKLLSGIN